MKSLSILIAGMLARASAQIWTTPLSTCLNGNLFQTAPFDTCVGTGYTENNITMGFITSFLGLNLTSLYQCTNDNSYQTTTNPTCEGTGYAVVNVFGYISTIQRPNTVPLIQCKSLNSYQAAVDSCKGTGFLPQSTIGYVYNPPATTTVDVVPTSTSTITPCLYQGYRCGYSMVRDFGYTEADMIEAVNQTQAVIPPLNAVELLDVLYRCIDVRAAMVGNSYCIAGCIDMAHEGEIENDQCAM